MSRMITVKFEDVDDSSIHREDLGDISGLAESIAFSGLLQNPGINESGQLLWGKRRLAAMKLIKWTECDFVIMEGLTPTERLKIEQAENEQRKECTPSEKVAIAKEIEEKLGNRAGRPKSNTKSDNDNDEEIPQNFVEIKGETSKFVAEQVGFTNPETYRQAKKVVETGDDKLIEEMDKGEKSIHAAYQATRPKREKMVELDIQLPDSVEETMDILEAAINRCCKSCDEPNVVLEHLRELL